MTDIDEAITSVEAAAILGLKRDTVTKLAKKLHLGRKIGRDVLFTPAELTVMQQRDTKPGPKPKG